MKLKSLMRLSFAWLLLCFTSNLYAINWVKQIRSNSLEEKLQVVIDTAQHPDFDVFTLSDPVRLVVDVTGKPTVDFSNRLSFQHRGVSKVRTGMHRGDKIRLVLELAKDFHWEAYPLPPENNRGHRVVIDVYDYIKPETLAKLSRNKQKSRVNVPATYQAPTASHYQPSQTNQSNQSGITYQEVELESPTSSVANHPVVALPTATTQNTVTIQDIEPAETVTVATGSFFETGETTGLTITEMPIATSTPVSVDEVPVTSPEVTAATITNDDMAEPQGTLPQHEMVVMIDPGHGGKDSGAIGIGGTKEKHIVLQIAKRLKRRINETYGIRAILTRSTDRYISLRGRLALAQKQHVDLFVSIHADAARNRSAKGSSIYILSNSGASSKTAQWLADRENAVDAKYGGDKGDYAPDIRNVMVKMQQDITIESSHTLASKTLRQLKGIGKVHKRRVERAGFAVLKSPSIPSMLVETAFISNPEEEKRLRTRAYQEKVAHAIALGIETYFQTQAKYRLILSGAQ